MNLASLRAPQLGKLSRIWPENSRVSLSFHQGDLIFLLQQCQEASPTAQIHGLMLKTGLDRIPFPASKLLSQICKQDMDYASSVFNQIENPNLFMLNSMLRGFSVSDDDGPGKCLVLFRKIRAAAKHIQELDQFTFISVLKSCSRLQEADPGLCVHAVALKSGYEIYLNFKNALVHFYCVWGRMRDAHQVFDELGERRDIVSWNSLMWGYVTAAEYDLVIDLFTRLRRGSSSGVSVTTVLGVLQASGETKNLLLGELLHVLCIKIGLVSDRNVVTALISMYGGEQRHIGTARQIFEEIDAEKDVIMWNCLMAAYAKTGLVQEAFELLKLMKHGGIEPSSSTLATLLSSCSASGALDVGQSVVRAFFRESPFALDAVVGTAMVDMCAKSGLLEEAINIFNRIEKKDVTSWTAMMSAYGLHGQPDRAISLFMQMEEEGCTPNEVTFLALLNCCSHGGMVPQGMRLLRRMMSVYKMIPGVEHYGCVIDLLGRAGILEEGYELMKAVGSDVAGWRALLGACRVYGDVELAWRVKDEIAKRDGLHPADVLAVTCAYAAAGTKTPRCYGHDESQLLHSVSVKKEAGRSSVIIQQVSSYSYASCSTCKQDYTAKPAAR